jgi:putative transposase
MTPAKSQAPANGNAARKSKALSGEKSKAWSGKKLAVRSNRSLSGPKGHPSESPGQRPGNLSQSLANLAVHIVFSTKNRKPRLKSDELRNELFAYAAKIQRANIDSPAIVIGGTEDHVHILCELSRKFSIMKVVQEVKTETTKWLKKQSPETADFTWQGGYGAFSVSESNVPQVKDYIQNQEEHHRRMTFQDELRVLCRRHNIELDERYVWD